MQVRLNAPDIVCEGCAAAITNALNRLPGVQGASVDVATKAVEVEFNEHQLPLQAILQRLEQAGFPARVVDSCQST
jgi:Cu+-exporting ATPase